MWGGGRGRPFKVCGGRVRVCGEGEEVDPSRCVVGSCFSVCTWNLFC